MLGTNEPTPRRAHRLLPISLLDLKLGARMLARYPGLTVVGGVAMAFAIAVGAGALEFLKDAAYPELPVEDGERIVQLRYVDTRTADRRPVPLEDFLLLRQELRSLDVLGAFHGVRGTLDAAEGGAPVTGAAITPEAFDLAGEAPLVGRHLVEADQAPGAAPVAVIGHGLWRSRFGADPGVVGRVVHLGSEQVTIVGVLAEGFAFPAALDLFVPLRTARTTEPTGTGSGGLSVPDVGVFGRLAPGATLADARAEIAGLDRAVVTDAAQDARYVSRQVGPFAEPMISAGALGRGGVMALGLLFLVGLVVVACVNVALLLFARAATREGEIAVRSALGASRSRIVGQLFAEALVLAAVATGVGLVTAAWGLRWVLGVMESQVGGALPPWIGDTLSPTTVAWAAVLGAVCAVVSGIVPALKVTGRDVQANLKRVAGRGAGIRLGGLWSGIIVLQVALTAMFVPIVAWVGVDTVQIMRADLGLPAEDYLAVELEADGEGGRFAETRRELERRLEVEPGVEGVTTASQLPGGWHPRRDVDVEGPAALPASFRHQPQVAYVAPDFFDVLGAGFVAGRSFAEGEEGVVVVNESFARVILEGRNAVGRRIRDPDEGVGDEADEERFGRWYEIVGVIEDLAFTVDPDRPHNAGVYHPLDAGIRPVMMAVHVPSGPEAFTGRLRSVAASLDPTLRLDRPMPMSQITRDTLAAYDTWLRVIVVAGGLALLLVNAGIYSVMSVTVSRRTREIGVRRALGAEPFRIVMPIFSRVLKQVALGVLAGEILLVLLLAAISEDALTPSPGRIGLLLGHMAFMTLFCLTACALPMRRALRVEPTEALREDG